MKKKREYFTSFLNLLDNLVNILNLTYIILDLKGYRKEDVRPLGAICILFMWLKFFYFMRLFRPTASLVRMIVQIIGDMKTFSLVLFLSIIAFGNCFYILSITSYDYDNCTYNPDFPPC